MQQQDNKVGAGHRSLEKSTNIISNKVWQSIIENL